MVRKTKFLGKFSISYRLSQRAVPTTIGNFRKLEILMTYYNNSFVVSLEPILFLWIPASCAIGCAFAAIRFQKILSFFEYVPFPAILTNCISMLTVSMVPATRVEHESNKLLVSLGRRIGHSKNKLWRKELASLRPFGVRLWFCSGVKREVILLSYYLISNYIFTIVIAIPESSVIA